MRFAAGSQSGAASAAAVFMPAPVGAGALAAATVPPVSGTPAPEPPLAAPPARLPDGAGAPGFLAPATVEPVVEVAAGSVVTVDGGATWPAPTSAGRDACPPLWSSPG